MTIIQSTGVGGIDVSYLRPRSTLTRGANVVPYLEDSAAAYEQIAGVKVPDASTISATPHVHDGTDGAIIPIPLHQSLIRAHLFRRDSGLSGGVDEDYFAFYVAPMWIPTGVNSVLVVCTVTNQVTTESIRVRSLDSTLAEVDVKGPADGFFGLREPSSPTYWLRHPTRATWCWRVSVTAGEWNVISWEAWDGYYNPGDESQTTRLPLGRGVRDVMVLPVYGPPRVAPLTYKPPSITGTDWKVNPSYVSFDDHLIDVADRMLPSYVLVNEYKNEALMSELLTGRPVGTRATPVFDGHNHADDAGTVLDWGGAEMEQPLGSWGYGTCRPDPGDTDPAAWLDLDCPSPGSSPRDNGSVWEGRIKAPAVASGVTGGTYLEVFRHRFRLPAATAANIANSTGKLEACILVSQDSDTTIGRVSIGNVAAGSFGSTQTDTSGAGTGRKLLTFSGVQGEATTALQTLKVEFGPSNTKVVPVVSINGAALAYVP